MELEQEFPNRKVSKNDKDGVRYKSQYGLDLLGSFGRHPPISISVAACKVDLQGTEGFQTQKFKAPTGDQVVDQIYS